MSTAAIAWPDGRTTAAHGPADLIGPHTLGACLAHTPHQLPEGVTSTRAPAPRSVIDAATWRYQIAPDGAVTVQRPTRDGRWTTITRQENTR